MTGSSTRRASSTCASGEDPELHQQGEGRGEVAPVRPRYDQSPAGTGLRRYNALEFQKAGGFPKGCADAACSRNASGSDR